MLNAHIIKSGCRSNFVILHPCLCNFSPSSGYTTELSSNICSKIYPLYISLRHSLIFNSGIFLIISVSHHIHSLSVWPIHYLSLPISIEIERHKCNLWPAQLGFIRNLLVSTLAQHLERFVLNGLRTAAVLRYTVWWRRNILSYILFVSKRTIYIWIY